MQVFLIRHGHSEWQAKRTLDRDSDLTPLGFVQAKALQERMKPLWESGSHVRLFSSPLKRSLQTAGELEADIDIDDRLTEADFHVSSRLHGRLLANTSADRSELDPEYSKFRQVVAEFLQERIFAFQGARNVVFAHGGVIKTALRIIAASSAIDFKILNCSVTEVTWSECRWTIQQLGDVSHLPVHLRT